MSKFNFFLILINWIYIKSNALVYKSCSEAIVKEKSSGLYSIQPLHHGNIANISCIILNNSYGVATLDNNLEKEHLVSGEEAPQSYKKFVVYENFNDNEVTAFLETITECSQGMTYITHASDPIDHGALFWDKLEINGLNAPDGICKCFISYNCIRESDPEDGCLSENEQELVIEEGLFSVKPSRLPIKAIYFGDTGSTNEFVKYKIWKLKCQFKIVHIEIVYPNNEYCSENSPVFILYSYVLIDGNKETCIDYPTKYLHLRIETLNPISSIELFGKNLSNSEINFLFFNESKQICIKRVNFIFDCQSTSVFNFFAFSTKESSIKLCEFTFF